jgi:hypothetical protein
MQTHCPFVNRPDSRCSERLRLDQLDHAFEFCFDSFNRCPVYIERLLEQRVRRVSAGVVSAGVFSPGRENGSPLVQLRLPTASRPATAA